MNLDELRRRIAAYQPLRGVIANHPDDLLLVEKPELLVPAAVLVPIIARPQPTLLLTKRHEGLRHHPGQVAFPGGRIDPGDADAISAALREAQEETGLAPMHVDVLGALDEYRTVTGYRVTPVVAIIPPDLPLIASADEVSALFEVPLSHALAPVNHQKRQIDWQGNLRDYYVIPSHPHDIWGATAGMLVNFASILKDMA